MKKYSINFINQNINILVDEGITIAKACEMAGFPLDLVCNGRGICGKCKVAIEDKYGKSTVLACASKIRGDIIIYLNNENYSYKANILENSNEENDIAQLNPSLSKYFIDIRSIKKTENEYLKKCDLYVLKKFSNLIYEKDCEGITYIDYENQIIDVQSNDTTKYLYGVSVDIGTTTVVLYIFDLNTGEKLKTYSNFNMQISMGADVISRIMYSKNYDNGLKELNEKIINTINIMLNKANLELPEFKNNLYNMVLCGNGTMQHLFFNLRPDGLGMSPFVNITKDYIECFGKEISLNCPDRCKVVFLPLLGGFVGSDTTSVLLTIPDDNKNRLIIDLGTNGEIAVGNIDGYFVASTACGPALEGGNIECGMRGTSGAIEGCKIEQDNVVLKIIGNVEPKGICGSGIIDAVAQLLKENIIDNTGRLVTKEEYLMIKPHSKLRDRLVKINEINCFVISCSNNEMIYISQKDIRQIQLAKSSIYSGCMSLIEANNLNLNLNKVDEIVLSGAFGNYIDVDNAIYIGLIPNVNKFKIKNIGNGAGKGVSIFILDKEIKNKCDKIINNTTHYELANDGVFAELYVDNMNFSPLKY